MIHPNHYLPPSSHQPASMDSPCQGFACIPFQQAGGAPPPPPRPNVLVVWQNEILYHGHLWFPMSAPSDPPPPPLQSSKVIGRC